MTTGKLWELAERPDMPSEPTLRRLIRMRPDFPLIERGRRGRDYLLDLDAAAAFVRANWADARRAKQRRAAAERAADPQLHLPLAGSAAPAGQRAPPNEPAHPPSMPDQETPPCPTR